MKSITVKDINGKPVFKVSHKKGYYLLEKWTTSNFTVMIIGYDNSRTVLGDKVLKAGI